MPLHSTITDPDLHEPKGISTASQGRVYVSNGAGSGSWLHIPSGWGYYQHNGIAQTFNTTDAKLLINGLGILNNTTHLPREIRGTSQLWSTVDSKITPIRVGDAYIVRLDLPVTARSAANELTVSLDIGGGATPTAVILPKFVGVGKTAPFTVSVDIPFVVLTSTTQLNGIQFFLKVDSGSIDVTNPSITVIRTHSGNI
jgi:hypothetical protein